MHPAVKKLTVSVNRYNSPGYDDGLLVELVKGEGEVFFDAGPYTSYARVTFKTAKSAEEFREICADFGWTAS